MYAPQVSIIMAVYNGEKYLQLAIDSVLSQNFRDYEFIIVDDCSNDSTPAIILSYQDERIVYIRNQKNLGQTPSLNIALNVAKGKYIARIDADDIYLQGKLEKQFVFMEKHPEVAVCGTAGIKIDENGDEISIVVPPTKTDEIFFNIFYGTPLIHVSVIMKTSIILKYGGYDEKFLYCADLALWSLLIKNHYIIANLPDIFIKYREFSQSLGAVKKLGESGEESTDIICSNILELTNYRISREQCRDIVLLFWPKASLSLTRICNAYINLIEMARDIYHYKTPKRILIKLKSILFWGIIKRFLYLKHQSGYGFIKKDILEIYRNFHNDPFIVIFSTFSYMVSLIGEKHILRLKRLVISCFKKIRLPIFP